MARIRSGISQPERITGPQPAECRKQLLARRRPVGPGLARTCAGSSRSTRACRHTGPRRSRAPGCRVWSCRHCRRNRPRTTMAIAARLSQRRVCRYHHRIHAHAFATRRPHALRHVPLGSAADDHVRLLSPLLSAPGHLARRVGSSGPERGEGVSARRRAPDRRLDHPRTVADGPGSGSHVSPRHPRADDEPALPHAGDARRAAPAPLAGRALRRGRLGEECAGRGERDARAGSPRGDVPARRARPARERAHPAALRARGTDHPSVLRRDPGLGAG